MSPRRLGTTTGILVFAILALFAFPRDGRAHFLDIIWEMSGPQLFGGRLYCKFNLNGSRYRCAAFGKRVGKENPPPPTAWFSLEGGIYTSTGKNTNNEYDWFSVHMLAFEPTVNVISNPNSDGAQFYHAAGISYDFLFGRDFRRFDKFGVKFVPAGVRFRRLDVAYTLRVYPNGFTADEFGIGERQADGDRAREFVHGIGFSF